MSRVRALADGLANLVTGLGTRRDARSARSYVRTILDQNQIAAAYSASPMLRKAIRIPALDALREWRDWQASAEQIKALEAEERRLEIPQKVAQAEERLAVAP